jgi:hypothetical protein
MRGRRWSSASKYWSSGSKFGLRWLVAGVAVMAVGMGGGRAGVAAPVKPAGSGACWRGVVEGEVRAGESFARPIGGGLEVRLEALSWGSGWLLRVLPVSGPRPVHDYAELATPPYASVSPLLLSTDFSFRAQDAVAWNPRRFRFAASAKEFAQMAAMYERYSRVSPPAAGVENELATVVSQAPEGTLQILDARLIPGTANQAQMAAMVASHFNTTPHTVEEPMQGKGSALGKLSWVRFRISLQLPRGFKAHPRLTKEIYPCHT